MINLNLDFKQTLSRYILNILGWHTNRKIVVIESDDWGSIRMPSREVLDILIKKGIRVDNLPYNKFDSLASEDDLTALFETLHSVKDINEKPAVITANTIVTNPDFKKIKETNFQEYHFEVFTETLKRYPNHSKSFELWHAGMQEGVFHPQLHGREHLNVLRWLKALKNNTGNIRLAFDLELFDLSESYQISHNSFMDAFNYEEENDLLLQKESIIEGSQIFKKLFGYTSTTFIAPAYIWSSKLNDTLKDCGINALQGGLYQLEPKKGLVNKFHKKFHYTGQKNSIEQIFLVRNVSFEPFEKSNFDWINFTLKQIQTAFSLKKPAIISSHRANYIGYIDKNNREKNTAMLKELLKKIQIRWPEVEFLTSDQLTALILIK